MNKDGRPERLIGLDLMRAIAIVAVLGQHLVHSDNGIPDWLYSLIKRGGSGVELFFALSGFLIGGILLEIVDRGAGKRAWGIFLVRRWMRTVPLYVVWVIILVIINPPPAIYTIEYLTFTQNFAWPMPRWFTVSWSLSIEEWFYLLFSGLLLFLAVKTKHAAVIACAFFIVLPVVARAAFGPIEGNWQHGFRVVVVYRLDAIAYGVLMAWFYRYRHETVSRWRYLLLWVGLALFALAEFYRAEPGEDSSWHYVRYTLLPASFSLMMPWAAKLHLAWSSPGTPIQWISSRSYCLYIVHVSVMHWVVLWIHGPMAGALALVGSMLIAELSFRYFETPILAHRPSQFGQPVMVEAASGSSARLPAAQRT